MRDKQNEAMWDFASRIKDTVFGGVKGTVSDHTNNLGNGAYGEAIRQTEQMSGDVKAWEDTISAYEDALNDLSSSQSERDTAQTMINDLQRRVDAYSDAYGAGGVNERAAQSVWSAADRLDDSARADIERAKQGLGAFGRGAVDFGVTGIELLSDKALKLAALYAKLFRLAGRDSQTARRSDADFDTATAYGGASGFSGAAIETLFDGINGIYGEGISKTEKAAKKIAKIFKLDKTTEKRIKMAFDDLGEGVVESPLTDLSNQALQSSYNGISASENLSEADWKQIVTNAVVNTILAALLQ